MGELCGCDRKKGSEGRKEGKKLSLMRKSRRTQPRAGALTCGTEVEGPSAGEVLPAPPERQTDSEALQDLFPGQLVLG